MNRQDKIAEYLHSQSISKEWAVKLADKINALVGEDETDNEITKRVLRKLLAENGWAWIQTWLDKEN